MVAAVVKGTMASRARDWLRQAEKDLEMAEFARERARHEWACFAAHQAAEKAVQALHLSRRQEASGHVVARLLEALPSDLVPPQELLDRARFLDGFYVPTRYPNGHPEGAPFEHYGPLQSDQAIAYAREILAYARDHMA